TYSYGNGDFYQGYGFVDASQGFAVGDLSVESGPNSTGQLGRWEITGVEDTGVDFNLQDQVQVTAYFDAESGKFAERLLAGGMDGLGSEGGLIHWHAESSPRGIAVSAFDRFSEADRPINSGADAQDERFTYTYFYGNGDSYSGHGFADVGDGFDAGQFLFSSQVNELGQPGFYRIDSTEALGADLRLEEQVFVTSYFDASSGVNAAQVTASGSSGLGSENGAVFWDDGLTSSSAFSNFTQAERTIA
ncbi:MAG: hypothetical protein HQL39_20675, partial [Alphaproteobacteria bacterium]|nr:hypothetical protein [Alphaproteobacteria bacterium]